MIAILAARRQLELAIMDVQELIETRPGAIARLAGVINGEAGKAAAQSSANSLFS